MITSQDATPFSARSWELTAGSDRFRNVHRFLLAESTAVPEVFSEFSLLLLRDGVIRLPFDECLFEFVKSDYKRLVLYTKQVIDTSDDTVIIQITPVFRDVAGEWTQLGNFPIQAYFERSTFGWDCHPSDRCFAHLMRYLVHLTAIATVIISSNSFISKIVVPPQRLQRARSRAGKPPLHEFRVIEIVPRTEIIAPPIGTHAPPALHWRRGHYRRLNDKIVSVAPCLVGNAENGIVEKAYDARKALG